MIHFATRNFVVALFGALFAFAALAQPIYTGTFSNTAVSGYDTVSYHDGTPVEGSKDFSTEWRGANWQFSSAENLARFKQDPTRYAPAYGGYCAWAVGAKNDLVKGDPKHWSVVDGRLYLNFNKSVHDRWKTDIAGFIAKADDNWPGLQ